MKARNRIILSVTAAGILAVGGVPLVLAVSSSAAKHTSSHQASLTAASCSGPTGAAYVAEPGYQGFGAVETSNCDVVQTYNVDDLQVPGDPGDYNYDGSDQGIALAGSTLWFAVTGTDNVAAIDTTTLDPSNYNPPETLVAVGLMPQAIAVTPDGSEVWVTEAGPQTSATPLYGIAVISTSSDTVVRQMGLSGDPTDVAFSPSGDRAYVTASDGLHVFDVTDRRQVAFVPGLSSPQSVTVSPDGSFVYVTETQTGQLATISTANDTVLRTTSVGDEPWQAAVSPNGSTVYVANPDSDSVSFVDAATGQVSQTATVAGSPDALAVTSDGSELWVTGLDSGILYVVDTATGAVTGQTNLGGDGAQSGDGLDPSGIVLTSTATPQN
ncbi:MAG TPA: YncE family protein [Acidimicrobiales bacterium]|nr:YncE family protein [Acidimicrobiales bacterium]